MNPEFEVDLNKCFEVVFPHAIPFCVDTKDEALYNGQQPRHCSPPAVGLACASSQGTRRERTGKNCPCAQQPKASTQSAQSPDQPLRMVPSPAMGGPSTWMAVDHCIRPQFVPWAWPQSHNSPCPKNSTWFLLAMRNLLLVLLSPGFKARRTVSLELNICRSCLKSFIAWFLRWSDLIS